MGDLVDVEINRNQCVTGRVRDIVDTDDVWPWCEADLIQRRLNGGPGRGRGQHDGRTRIVQRDGETLGVALPLGGEQRHRDGARLDRGEESGDVIETLWSEYRHPVSTRRGLLYLCSDGPHPPAEFRPGQFDRTPLRRPGVVQIAIGDGITHVRDVAVDKRNERDAGRQNDFARGVQAVLDLQQPRVISESEP